MERTSDEIKAFGEALGRIENILTERLRRDRMNDAAPEMLAVLRTFCEGPIAIALLQVWPDGHGRMRPLIELGRRLIARVEPSEMTIEEGK